MLQHILAMSYVLFDGNEDIFERKMPMFIYSILDYM